ncbi:hypothetical protein [Cohnella sp. WQ 127256]|uniref:hypothetical protein n=1 Tax=Cohnella sp. WQ 127256 TaxID=2938790 RepID=UPI002119351E|nr:hypothetical protein [Cohnella sp. WQ 127256]
MNNSLQQIFETNLSVINDSGKPKVYGKLKKNGKFIKKSPDKNIEIGRLHKVVDEVNDMIEKGFMISKIEKMKIYINKGMGSVYSIDAVNLAIDIHEYYKFIILNDNEPTHNKLLNYLSNERTILSMGKSASGKSAGIRSFIPKEYWNIFEIIVGLRETSMFENEYHLITDPSIAKELSSIVGVSENGFSIRPTMKRSKSISDLIQGSVHNFLVKIDVILFEKTDPVQVEGINWSDIISQSLSAFVSDQDRIFNIELLLGKRHENHVIFEELKKLLKSVMVEIERTRLKKQSEMYNSDALLDNKITVIRELHTRSEDKAILLENLSIEYNRIFEEQPILDDLKLLMFEEIIKIVISLFSRENVENYSFNSSTLIEAMNYFDSITQDEDMNFIKLTLPSKNGSKEINNKIRRTTSDILKSFYANNKQVKDDKSYASPLVERMEVWLPCNDKFEHIGLNVKIIDTIGLDHGEKIDSIKFGNRALNYINNYHPDVVLFNINITEKQDILQYAMESVKNSGYLEKTFILAGHSDEVVLDILKKDYLETFLENKTLDQLGLSSRALDVVEEGDGDILSVINLLDKADQDKISSLVLIESLESILQTVEYNYVEEQINTSLKLNYNTIKERVFMIDRLDNFTTMIGDNLLSLMKVQERLLQKVKEIIEIQTRSVLLVKNSVKIDINEKYFHEIVREIYYSFIEQERTLYERDNQDFRWITLDTGLYEMKNDFPGQYRGISYDITPGFDFAAIFNKGILAVDNAQKTFELKFNIVVDEDKKLLYEKFKTNFSRILYEIAHFSYITNNLNQISDIYSVRYGKRIYHNIPMTTERKKRMFNLIETTGADSSYVESLIRIALKLATEELYF